MKVSYNWLKEFVDFDLLPDELSPLLTMLGLEVDSIERIGEGLDDVIVAKVEVRGQHPNADKLSLCRVNNGKEILNIVCGAQNFKTGDKVALAQIGVTLPGDFKIKRSKIRGEESFGMLCSEKELALADVSDGIMILAPELPLGIPVFEALGVKDTIFEIGLTPNRADCLSIIGVAREIAAKLGKKVQYKTPVVEEGNSDIFALASVVIEDPDLCPRYTARYISGCKIAPSPTWLVNRLKTLGQRSINNVVDVTNFVLMEYGHPLHAFDFRQLAGGKIIVKRGGYKEKFVALDGQERELLSSDLTICDNEKAVALAGIMGGENSEIADDTTDILLESAYFNPSAIRLTCKRLGLHTESSHRFERGADVKIVTEALDRAAALIVSLSGGSVAKGTIDVYPFPVKDKYITARISRINAILGLNLMSQEIEDIFQRLEFAVETLEPGILKVGIPSFRVDIEREIDLIEEVARLFGFENIPTTVPKSEIAAKRVPREQLLEREVKNLFVGEGFNEVINFSFASNNDLERLNLPDNDLRRSAVKLMNPLVDEHEVMRTTLLPALLQTASRNFSQRNINLRLFEMRRVYWPQPDAELPSEPIHIAGIMTGLRNPEGWNQSRDVIDFYDLKGVLEKIAPAFNLPPLQFHQGGVEPFYHPGKSAAMIVSDQLIGSLGEIHPDLMDSFELDRSVYYFELDFAALVQLSGCSRPITAPSRFPDVTRDIAILVESAIPAASIVDCIKGTRNEIVRSVSIFDLYTGDRIPEGKKSLALRIRYGSYERTLTDEEVNRMHQKITNVLVTNLKVVIR